MENPFAGLDIQIADDFRENIDTYVRRSAGAAGSPLNQPFSRNVDIWFLAILWAVKNKLKPSELKGSSYKAAEGVVLASDNWRVTALILLAIAETDDPEIVDKPSEMLRIANSYANAGLPHLFVVLENRGNDFALDTLCDQIESLVE